MWFPLGLALLVAGLHREEEDEMARFMLILSAAVLCVPALAGAASP